MGVDDRIGFFILGCFLGFVMGYVVRHLREIRNRLDEVDIVVKPKNEDGFLETRFGTNIVMVMVLLMTAGAAFFSQRASDRVEDTQSQVSQTLACHQDVFESFIEFVGKRTELQVAQGKNASETSRKQLGYWNEAFKEPVNYDVAVRKLKDYLASLEQDVQLSSELANYTVNSEFYKDPGIDKCVENLEE